jgi:hypothetical protein
MAISSLWAQATIAWDWKTVVATIACLSVLNYLFILIQSSTTVLRIIAPRRPPMAPYLIPYVGHGIDFVTRPFELYESNKYVLHGNSIHDRTLIHSSCPNSKKYGRGSLWKLALPGLPSYQTNTPEHAAKVFRAQHCSGTESHYIALEHSFGMTRKAIELVSGHGLSQPHCLRANADFMVSIV